MKKKFTYTLILLALLTGCASSQWQPGGTATLCDLEKVRAPYRSTGHPHSDKVALSSIRFDMLKETALSLGARAGLAWRSKQINKVLSANENDLDATYNYYGLMLPHDVLPPVLVQAQDILNLADPDTLRLAQKTYRIAQQARFVTAPPTWRDFIWMNYTQPDLPDSTLLPRNNIERKAWTYYVRIGWQDGIMQAGNIFQDNLNALNQNYNGMVLYRKLYQMNMVSAPFVAKTDLGITGDGEHMDINDQVLRITALPQLNLNGNTWRAIVVPDPIEQIRLKLKLTRQIVAIKITNY